MAEPNKPRRRKSVKGMEFREQADGSFSLIPATDEQAKNADRSRLSISVAHDVENCPAAQLGKNNLPRLEDPFDANVLGSGAHDVLEHLYLLPPAKRTEDAFKRLAAEVAERVWSEEKLVDQFPPTVEANRELRQKWLATVEEWALRDLLIENPQNVDVVATEMELSGYVTSNGVVSTGKIDRVDRLEDGTFKIVDHKFGVWKEPNPRFKDGYKEQGHLYFDLFTTGGHGAVSKLAIHYPREPHIRAIPLIPEEIQNSLSTFKETREALTGFVERKDFPATPGPLCAWCDLARACPVARIRRPEALKANKWVEENLAKTAKAVRSANTKRTAVQLGIPVVLQSGESRLNDDGWLPQALVDVNALVDAGSDQQAFKEVLTDIQQRSLSVPASAPILPPPLALPAAPAEVAPRIPESPDIEGVIMTNTAPMRPEGRMDQEMVGAQLNLASTAARNIADINGFTLWLLQRDGQRLTGGTIATFSRIIAKLTRRVAQKVSGQRTLQSGVASRSLYAVKDAVKAFPPPFTGDEQTWAAWMNRVETLAVATVGLIDTIYADDDLDMTSLISQAVSIYPAIDDAALAPFNNQPTN